MARRPTLRVMALLASLLVLAVTLPFVQGMGVVGIDYGTEASKISLVKPGLPFDVVLGRDSKRKVPSAVAWKDQERLYGSDATGLATRFPGDVFIAAKLLLGRSFDQRDEKARQRVAELLGTNLIPSERQTCAVQRATDYTLDNSGADVYSVEEIVASQLGHFKVLAEETAGEEFRRSYPGTIGSFGGLDVVITVPIYWTAAERQAMMDAANIAGFKPRLVSDGAAVGVNYAQTRTFPTPERHLFYDAGAGSTRATIVEFSTKTIKADSILSIGSTQKEAVIVDVLSAGWDRRASGLAIDVLLRDILADAFTKAHGSKLQKPVREQPRAMARLLKEANRVKHILSANAEASVNIEGLAEEVDFRSRVSREELEKAVAKAGLTDLFGEPVTQALKDAKLKVSDLTSVVLVGGTSRVPLVQAALRAAGVPDSMVAQNVNADEAAVMGAAFFGASFNPQFRMKSIRAYDGNPYPVVLRDSTGKEDVIFPAKSFEEEKVTRQFKDTKADLLFDVAYADSVKARLDTFDEQLYTFEMAEIEEALRPLKESGEIDQVEVDFNVTFATEPVGIYNVESAWLNVRQKPGGIAGALKSFFSVGKTEEEEEDDVEAADNATTAEGEAANATTTTKAKKVKKPLPTDRAVRITGRALPAGRSNKPMSGDQLKAAKDRLYVADVEARRRAAKEESRNLLEASIYRARDIVHEEGFGAASKPAERDAIAQKADELNAWMNEEGDTAGTDELKAKKTQLDKLVAPIERRIAEQGARGPAMRGFAKALEDSKTFVAEARKALSEALAAGTGSKFSVAELDTLDAQIAKDAKWYADGEAKQATRGLDEDPVFKVEELEKKAKKLRDTVKRLNARRIPKTRPPKKAQPPPPPPPPPKPKEEKPAAKEETAKEEKKEPEAGKHDEL